MRIYCFRFYFLLVTVIIFAAMVGLAQNSTRGSARQRFKGNSMTPTVAKATIDGID